jgi:hypothetical protein
MSKTKIFQGKIKKLNSKIGFALTTFIFLSIPNLVFAGSDTDFNKVSHPLVILGKLIMLFIGLIYITIGMMWVWLPAIVIMVIRKKYAKLEEERGEEHTKDMLMKMGIGGFGAVIVSFIMIGLFGQIFFNADSLLSGIQSYYGGMIKSIQQYVTTSFGLSSGAGAGTGSGS